MIKKATKFILDLTLIGKLVIVAMVLGVVGFIVFGGQPGGQKATATPTQETQPQDAQPSSQPSPAPDSSGGSQTTIYR